MKKHDEGYALVLVLVVMIVMSLVAASVLTFSLRNLTNQQKSIQRMEDKYEAMGEIEAEIQNLLKGSKTTAASKLEDNTLYVTLSTTHGTATVTCTLKFTNASSIPSSTTDGTVYYTLTNLDPTYDAYEITYKEES